MSKQDGNCTRCKGRGRGDWAPEYGKCYGCQGKGTYAAQVAIKAKAKADAQHQAEVEPVTILVGPVDSRRDATMVYALAFLGPEGDGVLPFFEQVGPGFYAVEIRMHVASVLEWLAR